MPVTVRLVLSEDNSLLAIDTLSRTPWLWKRLATGEVESGELDAAQAGRIQGLELGRAYLHLERSNALDAVPDLLGDLAFSLFERECKALQVTDDDYDDEIWDVEIDKEQLWGCIFLTYKDDPKHARTYKLDENNEIVWIRDSDYAGVRPELWVWHPVSMGEWLDVRAVALMRFLFRTVRFQRASGCYF